MEVRPVPNIDVKISKCGQVILYNDIPIRPRKYKGRDTVDGHYAITANGGIQTVAKMVYHAWICPDHSTVPRKVWFADNNHDNFHADNLRPLRYSLEQLEAEGYVMRKIEGVDDAYLSSCGTMVLNGEFQARFQYQEDYKGRLKKVSLLTNKMHKTYYMHRLVALTFVDPNPLKYTEVVFLDGNTMNCAADNLAFMSRSDRKAHYHRLRKKLEAEEVPPIPEMVNAVKPKSRPLTEQMISMIREDLAIGVSHEIILEHYPINREQLIALST